MKKCMSGCGGKMMSKGGKVSPVKKMKKGGITQDIVGMPGYNATLYPTSFKKGGAASTTNRAVSPSCKGGLVKDASGKCVNERKFKNGGATSFGMLSVKAGIDKNPKPTAADRIAGAKMKKKMGGSTKRK